jgi:amino acid transporter
MVLVGILYIFAAYTSVLGFGGADSLSTSTAPISDLAERMGMGGFTPVVDLGITASFFAVIIASINAAARVLYTMGEEGVLPAPLGRAHRRYKTPHVAIFVIAPVVALVPIIMVASGTTPFNVYAYTGTIGTFGYMLAYLLMAASLPIFRRRRGEANPAATVLAVVVVLAILYVVYKNLVPIPPSPYNLLPYMFAAAVLLGLAWYLFIRVTAPERARQVGTYEEEPVPAGHPDPKA